MVRVWNTRSGPEPFGKSMRDKYFNFDPSYLPLNHGSYGTIPTPVRDHQRRLQDSIEARSDPFIRFEIPELLVESRIVVAGYLGAPPEDVVLVPNATTAINTVLRNLTFEDGDVIVHFSCAYPGCLKTIQQICESTPARRHCIDVTFPVEDDELVNVCVKAFEGIRSQDLEPKVFMFDTVVTFPGVRLPWERLVEVCRQAGVLSLVDGAHGIGHIDLTGLHETKPDLFTSNCYKWLFTPRACAVLYVPRRNHHLLRTSIPTSHGFQPLPSDDHALTVEDQSHGSSTYFTTLFEWVATIDQTPYLCIPAAATSFRNQVCGGEPRIRDYCFGLARSGGALVASRLGTEVMSNTSGSSTQCCFTNVRLPVALETLTSDEAVAVCRWIMDRCLKDHDTFIPCGFYAGKVWVRLSAQIYLDLEDFGRAARILEAICERVARGEWRDASRGGEVVSDRLFGSWGVGYGDTYVR